jgi:acetylornithine deacetylase/succinyl-diaminopimelate desuccinylase-like protein
MDEIYRFIDEHLEESLADLARLVELPSVSAQKQAIQETAEHVARLLEGTGFRTRILPKPGGAHPVVCGELEGASPRTLVFYNHYDVQPPEPLELWNSPPFQLTRRDNRLYARGVSDDKGDIVSRLAAVRAFQAVRGRAPLNIKFCIEGDEEIGSPELEPFVLENRDLLKGDACIWEGASVDWEGALQLYAGVKGLLYVQLEARGASRDVHSSWGTVVPNPAWCVVWALSTLKDVDERILIDGFYDGMLRPTPEEEAAVQSLPADEGEQLRALDLPSFLKGVRGVEYHRRHVFEPTCTIDGLTSGYQGEGTKTVLPATASAKLDFRLVPEQDPEDVLEKMRRHLDRHGFQDVKVVRMSGEKPVRTPLDSPFVELVRRTAAQVYGRAPRMAPNMAGTGPMYHFVRDLGLPTVGAGVGYSESRAHAPDENIRVGDFVLGTKHIAAILGQFAEG